MATSSVAATEQPTQDRLASTALDYQEAINLASSAFQLSQSAISPDDWSLVESKWRRAIQRLEKVGSHSSHYDTAQVKIAEYTHNVKHAVSQVTALQASANTAVASQRPSDSTLPSTSIALTASNQKVIPIVRRLHGTPIVRVTFNNQKTYDMILDTGASRTLITRAMADELKVITTERMIAATASDTEVVFELGRIESIAIGEIVLNNARVSIGDSVNIGLLGNDFLNGYDITIRGRENVVELVRY